MARLGFEPRPTGYIPGALPIELPSLELLSRMVLLIIMIWFLIGNQAGTHCPGHVTDYQSLTEGYDRE